MYLVGQQFLKKKNAKRYYGEKGRLIVFEGTDCSGKSTQIDLFIDKLKNEGKSVVVLDFPNYSTGTWGPKEADQLLENNGRSWITS